MYIINISEVNNLTVNKLLSISSETVKQIIHQISYNDSIRFNKPISNGFNAEVTSINIYRGRLFVNIHCKYGNYDFYKSEFFEDFINKTVFTYDNCYYKKSKIQLRFKFSNNIKAELIRILYISYINKNEI